jgi:curved DNA-binding protein CbpA
MSKKKKNVRSEQEMTPYEILAITETASIEEIRKAYLKNVRLHPPEKDPQGFKRIKKAYTILKDAASRKTLDISLFKIMSDIDIPVSNDIDFVQLFKDRIFSILLSSSDLYISDFRSAFNHIDDKIRKLR